MPFLVLICLLSLFGCHHTMQSSHQHPKADLVLNQLEKGSAQTKSLIGHFKLRGTGIKRLLGSIELDIIAKEPHFLYLSIESFFKQPARIITYDGSKIYGLSERHLDKILDLPLEPVDLVGILLRRVSIDRAQIKKLVAAKDSLTVQFRSGQKLELSYDTDYAITQRKLLDASGNLIYAVVYKQYPKEFYLEASHQDQKHGMTLTSQDVRLNEGSFDEQLFRR